MFKSVVNNHKQSRVVELFEALNSDSRTELFGRPNVLFVGCLWVRNVDNRYFPAQNGNDG